MFGSGFRRRLQAEYSDDSPYGARILLEFGVVAQRFALLDSIPAVKSDVSGYFATSYGK